VLELLEDVPRGHHQDPVAAAAPDQLGEDHADLERLAEADRVGDQQPRPECLQRRLDRMPLVLKLVQELPMSHGQAGLGRRQQGLVDQRLEVQAAAPESGSRVQHQGGVLRPQRLDVVQLGEEGRLLVADQLGGADYSDELAIRRGLLERPDEPLLVADHDLRPWAMSGNATDGVDIAHYLRYCSHTVAPGELYRPLKSPPSSLIHSLRIARRPRVARFLANLWQDPA
jgi:hypothetical protein